MEPEELQNTETHIELQSKDPSEYRSSTLYKLMLNMNLPIQLVGFFAYWRHVTINFTCMHLYAGQRDSGKMRQTSQLVARHGAV